MLQLALPSDEAGKTAPCGNLQLRAQRTDAEHFVDLQRLGDPFDGRLSQRLELEVAFRQFVGVRTDHNGARRCQIFHARGEVGRMPDWDIISLQVVLADGAYHYFSSIDADAEINRHATFATALVSVATHCVLHQ